MSEDVADLETASRRIRGLLAKTVANGATEEEALSAAAHARKLMDKHRLSMSDIEMKAEPIDTVTFDRPFKNKYASADYCLPGIQRYCGVKMWYTTAGKTRRITLFGLRGDVEMARYLYDMIAGVIKAEADRFRKAEHEARIMNASWEEMNNFAFNGQDVSESFQVGMGNRINERLVQMAIDLEPTAMTGSGNALVVVKGALVDDAYAKLNLHLSNLNLRRLSVREQAAYGQGRSAGDRVNLGRPISTNSTNRQRLR